MKKLISILLILLMLALVFVSCNTDGKDDEANSGTSESKEEISSEQQNTSETTQEETTEEETTEEITTVAETKLPSENLWWSKEQSDKEVVLYIMEKWNEVGLSYKIPDPTCIGGCWLIDSCYVFMPNGMVSQMGGEIMVGKYTLWLEEGAGAEHHYAYKDGKFYTLTDAYEKGIITEDGVHQLAKAIGAKIIE